MPFRRTRAALAGAREIYRRRASSVGRAPRDRPDVYLDVQRLRVDRVRLNVEELSARVALQAHILDLLRLDVGVDADLRGVGLEIDGVDAEAVLEVRLEHLTTIVDRVMTTIERNPQLLENLVETVDGLGAAAAGAIRPRADDAA